MFFIGRFKLRVLFLDTAEKSFLPQLAMFTDMLIIKFDLLNVIADTDRFGGLQKIIKIKVEPTRVLTVGAIVTGKLFVVANQVVDAAGKLDDVINPATMLGA